VEGTGSRLSYEKLRTAGFSAFVQDADFHLRSATVDKSADGDSTRAHQTLKIVDSRLKIEKATRRGTNRNVQH